VEVPVDSERTSNPNRNANGILKRVDWDGYCKSGNKASTAWLLCLFSLLGFCFQQASLSTVASRATTLRSTLDERSFEAPAEATQKMRKMMEVVVQEEEEEAGSDGANANEKAIEEMETDEPPSSDAEPVVEESEVPQQTESSIESSVDSEQPVEAVPDAVATE
jgi:hypothetical protein